MKRIAFLLTGWTLTTFIMQLAEALAGRGVPVDIFCDRSHTPMVDSGRMSANPLIRLLLQQTMFNPPRTREDCRRFLRETCAEIFPFGHALEYGAIVGIEKMGAALAFLAAKDWKVPLVYWSLELYDLNHDEWAAAVGCPECWLEMEALAHKAARGTIIQDKDRGDALSRLTGRDTARIYLPVTIGASEVAPQGGHFLHRMCGLPPSQKLLLQFGNNRMHPEWLLRVAQALPESWTLVLHGLTLWKEKVLLRHPRLLISLERCAEKNLPALVASASAGLVHYEKRHINDVLTAHSSEKLARYLAAGVPVVAHDVGNFAKAFAENGAGITYSTPEQIGMVLRLLDRKPEVFHQAALRAGQGYLFENAGTEAVEYLCRLASA